MEELSIESSPTMRKTTKLYLKFLENKERKSKLQNLNKTYQNPISLHVGIISILCGVNGGSVQDIMIAVLKAGLIKEDNELLSNIEKFGNIEVFWQLVQKYTGYVNSQVRPLSEFACHLLITALSQTLPESALRGLERYISDSSKAYCYQLVHEWQRRDDFEDFVELSRFVENELRLVERFDRTDVSVLLRSDIFPSIDESILKRIFTDISENIIKSELIKEVVENRRTSRWYESFKNYVESLNYISEMQDFYLANNQRFHIVEPVKIWNFYINEGFLMDQYYRQFHFYYGNALNHPNYVLEDLLKKCTDVV